MQSILFVDDEVQILKSLKRVFFKSSYELYFANSAKEGLECLEKHSIDVVISDVKMPVMDGFEFLKIVKDQYPQITRLLLSGYAEADTIMSALDNGIALAFVNKPWENQVLVEMIEAIFRMRAEIQNAVLLKDLNNSNSLPSIPDWYIRIVDAIQSEKSISEIAHHVEKDPALVSRLLKLANSGLYPQSALDTQKAIILIGINNFKTLLMTQTLFQQNSPNHTEDLLWEHAILTTKILKEIREFLRLKTEDKVLTTMGLLHNIGMIFLFVQSSEKFHQILSMDSSERVEELFIQQFSISHTIAGNYLLNWWHMPLPLHECARFYSTPSLATSANQFRITLVHLASHLAWKKIDRSRLNHKLEEDTLRKFILEWDKLKNTLNTPEGYQ